MHTHTYTRAHAHTHTHPHAHTHTHIHTRAHTHTPHVYVGMGCVHAHTLTITNTSYPLSFSLTSSLLSLSTLHPNHHLLLRPPFHLNHHHRSHRHRSHRRPNQHRPLLSPLVLPPRHQLTSVNVSSALHVINLHSGGGGVEERSLRGWSEETSANVRTAETSADGEDGG